jgi:hypothetical protein
MNQERKETDEGLPFLRKRMSKRPDGHARDTQKNAFCNNRKCGSLLVPHSRDVFNAL